jgi:hypothetical protein
MNDERCGAQIFALWSDVGAIADQRARRRANAQPAAFALNFIITYVRVCVY